MRAGKPERNKFDGDRLYETPFGDGEGYLRQLGAAAVARVTPEPDLPRIKEYKGAGSMTTAKKLLATETRAAEVIVRVLEEAGIDMVFGIAGGQHGPPLRCAL